MSDVQDQTYGPRNDRNAYGYSTRDDLSDGSDVDDTAGSDQHPHHAGPHRHTHPEDQDDLSSDDDLFDYDEAHRRDDAAADDEAAATGDTSHAEALGRDRYGRTLKQRISNKLHNAGQKIRTGITGHPPRYGGYGNGGGGSYIGGGGYVAGGGYGYNRPRQAFVENIGGGYIPTPVRPIVTQPVLYASTVEPVVQPQVVFAGGVPASIGGNVVYASGKKERDAATAIVAAEAAVAAIQLGRDEGITYADHHIYTAHVSLQFSGTPHELSSGGGGKGTAAISAADVGQVFAIRPTDPDVTETDPGIFSRAGDTAHMFVSKVEVLEKSSTFQTHVKLLASDTINDWNVVHIDGAGVNTAMLVLPPNASSTTPDCLLSRDRLLRSSLFKKYGHISAARLNSDVALPAASDADQRPSIPAESVLARIIDRNRDRLMRLAVAERGGAPLWDGDLTPDSQGNIRLPPIVPNLAIKWYTMKVSPLTRGIVDASDGLVFRLEPMPDRGDPATRHERHQMHGTADVLLRISYVYPQSAIGRYQKKKHACKPSHEVFHQESKRAARIIDEELKQEQLEQGGGDE